MRAANVYLIEKNWESLMHYINSEKRIKVKNDITLYLRGANPYCIAISVSEESDAIIKMVDTILLAKGNGMINSFLNNSGTLLYGDEVNLGFIEIYRQLITFPNNVPQANSKAEDVVPLVQAA